MRLGLFGGTFDPPHSGHLIVAQDALHALRLDRVVFVPAAVPPHKRRREITDAAVRLEMVRAAITGDPRFVADDVELRREGPSYTVDTLRAYRAQRPDAAIFLLLGADQYADFDTWREPQAIRDLATLAVLSRSGVDNVEGEAATARPGHEAGTSGPRVSGGQGVVRVAVTRIDLSSTDIRRRVSAGEPIRYLVPDAVERLIRERALYVPPGGSGASNRTAAAG